MTHGFIRSQARASSSSTCRASIVRVADDPVARGDVVRAPRRPARPGFARSPTRTPRRAILSSYAGPMPRDVVPILRSPRRASLSRSSSR